MDNLDQSYPLWSYQPLRLAYNIYDTVLLVARLPYWVFVSAVPSLRPLPQWTFKQTMMARILRAAFHKLAVIGITETHTLNPGQEGDRFQIIPPSPKTAYVGPVASVPEAQPVTIGGTWYPTRIDTKDMQAKPSKIVVLHIHGGAFIWGDGRTACSGFLAQIMQEEAGADAVLSIQYRLSAHGGKNPFPAALQDALTAYLFLVHTLEVPPANIVLFGDSSGATIVTGLLRYLGEYGHELQLDGPVALPRCAILTSPMIAPLKTAGTGPLNKSPYRTHANFNTDFVPLSTLRWGWQVYAGGSTSMEAAAKNPYFTPLGHPFATTVPIFISVGRSELFLPENETWAAEMQAVSGNNVTFSYEEYAPHETLLLGRVLGFEESARGVARKLAGFIHSNQERVM